MSKEYYKAYDERYKTIHQKGFSWASDTASPIVMETIQNYNLTPKEEVLEIGCGEGRDSKVLLERGYNLLATDISEETIAYCRRLMPKYSSRFQILDCLSDELNKKYDFIYAVAVIHMLVLDEDRNRFYRFISKHLKEKGLALICTMGDGEAESQSDIRQAFVLQERQHSQGSIMVAGTSCRMVSFPTFQQELKLNGLNIIQTGITSALPDFNSLMYAVVKNKEWRQENEKGL